MLGFAKGLLLAQFRPSSTGAELAFTASLATEVTRIVICNTSGAPANASIYQNDAGGGTYGAGEALLFGAPITNGALSQFVDAPAVGCGLMLAQGAQIAVQSSVASALTFSIYGAVADQARLSGV